MNSIKQILNFELNFLSNRIPYIKRNQTDGKINYFCIYRYYFNDGIKIYKVEPNQIAILDFKDNKIKENQYKVKNSCKIKPIVSLDNQKGDLYFIFKENNINRIGSWTEKQEEGINYLSKINEKKLKNYCTKLLVHDSNIFIVQPNKITKLSSLGKQIKAVISKKTIIAATCDSQHLVFLTDDKTIKFYDIPNLNLECELISNDKNILIDSAYLFLNKDFLNIYSLQNKLFIKKRIDDDSKDWTERGDFITRFNFNAIQDINQNFINKYINKPNSFEIQTKYKEILPFVSGIGFPDDSYAGDILFFGPSIYLPIKKDASNSLYSKLEKIKSETFLKSSKFSHKLAKFSKKGDIERLNSEVKKILKNSEGNDLSCNNDEIEYFLDVIKLPEDIKEESTIPSSLMPNFFNFIIAEIFNTFLNLLIIKGLIKVTNKRLDEEIQVYSSLYKIISSDLIKYHSSKNVEEEEEEEEEEEADDEDEENNKEEKEEEFIQSNLYILNSSFSPISLRDQLCFLYKGRTTFSKLSKEDILKYNEICPDPIIEQRTLDVAKAYLETNDFDKCIEYLEKIDTKNESLPSIQNTYINHLLKMIPNDFEKQFKLLRTLNKRLPKNMYKTLYIISLKSNQFSVAIDEFCSNDAIISLASDVSKNSDLEQYKDTINSVLSEKDIFLDILSKLK